MTYHPAILGNRELSGRRHRRRHDRVETQRTDPLLLTLVLLTIVSLSQIHQHFLPLAAVRPALLLNLAAVGLAVLRPGRLALQNIWSTWPGRIVVGLGVAAALSVVFGISMGRAAVFFLSDYGKTLLMALLLIGVVRSTKDVVVLVRAYVIASAVLVWMAFFLFDTVSSYDGTMRLNDLYSYDGNDLGLILTSAIPLTLIVLHTSGRVGKWASVALLVGIALTLARTGSRGAFVGMVVVGVGVLAVSSHISLLKRLAASAGLIGALIVGAPEGYWDRIGTLLSPTEDYNWTTVDGRKEVAARGVDYMLQYPLFGLGVNNFPMAEGVLSEKAREHVPGTGIRWTAAHNTYVQVGAEMGVPGLALWLFLLLGGAVLMHRIHRRLPRAWAHGGHEQRSLYFLTLYLPIAVLGFMATSTFVSFAYLGPPYILAACMAGVCVCARHIRVPLSNVRARRVPNDTVLRAARPEVVSSHTAFRGQ